MAVNTWGPGPQQLTQVVVDDGAATTITANLIQNWSLTTEKEEFDAAIGFPVRRGYTTKTGSFDCLDYGAVTALEGMMTDRDLVTVTSTYQDGDTQDVFSAAITAVPLVGLIPDSCTVYIKAYNATSPGKFDGLTGSFVNLGSPVNEPSYEFSMKDDVVDGCGRPWYAGQSMVEAEFELAGLRGADTDVYAAAYAFENVNVDVAISMPSGKFMALNNVYSYVRYGDEDSTGVRTVVLTVRGVAASFSALLSYTDGAATATNDIWGVETAGNDPGDMFAGATVTFVGVNNIEDDSAGSGAVDWTTA